MKSNYLLPFGVITYLSLLAVLVFMLLGFNGHFPGGPGLTGTRLSPLWILLEWNDGGDGDNWSYKIYKAPVKRHHQQTNTQYFTGRYDMVY